VISGIRLPACARAVTFAREGRSRRALLTVLRIRRPRGKVASSAGLPPASCNRNVGKVTHILNEKQERFGTLTVFDVADAAIWRLADGVPPVREGGPLPAGS
jgi:hypothetical protein